MSVILLLGLALLSPFQASARPAIEQGSGASPALYEERPDLPDHVVYRPRDLTAVKPASLGIYVFGNGGCSADGTSSRNHLRGPVRTLAGGNSEMALQAEVVVDVGMYRGELLQHLHLPEPEHRTFSPSERQV